MNDTLQPGLLRTAMPPPTAARRPRRRIQQWHWAPYVFIAPFFVLFTVFGVFPLLFSVYLSFQQWDPASGLGGMTYVGWDNYVYALKDDYFRKSLWNTVWIAVVSGVPQQLVALPLAFFLHTAFGRWRNAFAGAYFLPFITSTVAITLVFTSMFSRDFGVFNAVLTWLGQWPVLEWVFPQKNIDWFSAGYTRWMVSFVVWWRYTGWITVLYLAALQTIPKDLYEAARVDGASRWQQFWYVTIPMLKPMMFFTVSLNVIGGLQLFEEPFIITNGTGGTGQIGKTAAMHLYATAFVDSDFGTASAVAWLMFIFIAAMAWLNNKAFSRGGMKD